MSKLKFILISITFFFIKSYAQESALDYIYKIKIDIGNGKSVNIVGVKLADKNGIFTVLHGFNYGYNKIYIRKYSNLNKTSPCSKGFIIKYNNTLDLVNIDADCIDTAGGLKLIDCKQLTEDQKRQNIISYYFKPGSTNSTVETINISINKCDASIDDYLSIKDDKEFRESCTVFFGDSFLQSGGRIKISEELDKGASGTPILFKSNSANKQDSYQVVGFYEGTIKKDIEKFFWANKYEKIDLVNFKTMSTEIAKGYKFNYFNKLITSDSDKDNNKTSNVKENLIRKIKDEKVLGFSTEIDYNKVFKNYSIKQLNFLITRNIKTKHPLLYYYFRCKLQYESPIRKDLTSLKATINQYKSVLDGIKKSKHDYLDYLLYEKELGISELQFLEFYNTLNSFINKSAFNNKFIKRVDTLLNMYKDTKRLALLDSINIIIPNLLYEYPQYRYKIMPLFYKKQSISDTICKYKIKEAKHFALKNEFENSLIILDETLLYNSSYKKKIEALRKLFSKALFNKKEEEYKKKTDNELKEQIKRIEIEAKKIYNHNDTIIKSNFHEIEINWPLHPLSANIKQKIKLTGENNSTILIEYVFGMQSTTNKMKLLTFENKDYYDATLSGFPKGKYKNIAAKIALQTIVQRLTQFFKANPELSLTDINISVKGYADATHFSGKFVIDDEYKSEFLSFKRNKTNHFNGENGNNEKLAFMRALYSKQAILKIPKLSRAKSKIDYKAYTHTKYPNKEIGPEFRKVEILITLKNARKQEMNRIIENIKK